MTCGTCQACEITTNTCGLPCSPASAGTALCTQVGHDGSYLRLTYYLTTKGFAAAGASNQVILYQSGRLVGSGLTTNFTHLGTPVETAAIRYVVDPNQNIRTFALVSVSGVPSYALSVDPSGRIVQTVVPQFNASASKPATMTRPAETVQQGNTYAVIPQTYHEDATSAPGTCAFLFSNLCDHIALGGVGCFLLGAALCAEGTPVAMAVCGIIAGIICSYVSSSACSAAEAYYCACPNGGITCGGVCCGSCMDCTTGPGAPTGECVADTTCTDQGLGPCCGSNNMCCPIGQTCVNGVCTSPNPGCVAATCETFVPCSTETDCVCTSVAEGGGLCVPGSTACAGLTTCSTSADCSSGSLCAIDTCCGVGVCIPTSLTCPSEASDAVRRMATTSGPTIGHR